MGNTKKKTSVINGFVWKFSERLVAQGISFFISLVLARILSPSDYGLISLVLVFITLASVFINSGFGTALIQKNDADSTDFSTMFYCSLICSIIIYFIIYLIAPFIASFYHEPELIKILRVFALQVPISVYNAIQNAYITRNLMFKSLFFSTAISSVVSGIVGITMALNGFGVWALVCQTITITISNTIVLGFILPWHPQFRFSTSSAKSMMRYGSQILAADLSGTLFGEIRSLIIGRVYTSADLAYYTKGQQLPQMIAGNLNTAVMSVLFPTISNESDDLEKVKQLTKRSLKILAYIIFPALLGLSAVMNHLIIILLSSRWEACIPYAQILCVGFSLGVLGIVPLQTLKAIGRSEAVLKLEVIKKPVYLILLVLGVKHSVLAIAVTMVLYEIYGLIVNMFQMKKFINYSIYEQFCDIFSSLSLSIIMAIIVYIIPTIYNPVITLFIKIIVGALFYIIVSIIFKIDSFKYLQTYLLKLKRK